MRDTELYRQLLGLEAPWTVTRVELAVKAQRVDIWAGHAENARWPCPKCGTALALYDHAEERIQPLGYLVWAACGKDPGFSPPGILEHAARSARYSAEEIRALSFSGAAPDAADLSRRWHAMLATAREIVARLPADQVGRCVLDRDGHLFGGGVVELASAIDRDVIVFHAGSVRGALPRLK